MSKRIALFAAAGLLSLNLNAADEPLGKQLLQGNCLGCHTPTEHGLSRMSQQRKSAEGWEMTINRMRVVHGLQLHHDGMSEGEVLGELVKYLADTQGLAPAETADVRYLLERNGNHQESFDALIAETCGRCHSSARVALQRRTLEEWDRTIDFHLGQWPSTEYSLLGRDRPWLKIAREQVIPRLAQDYPLDTQAWRDWQAMEKPQPEGDWVLTGHVPGEGEFSAVMTVTPVPDRADQYQVSVNGHYADGSVLQGSGSAIVYTGFEWRASINVGGQVLNQAFALAEDGSAISGRMYQRDQEQIGAPIKGIRQGDQPTVLSVYPHAITAGGESVVTVTGTGLDGVDISLDGLEVTEVISSASYRAQLKVRSLAEAGRGQHGIRLGDVATNASVASYERVDALSVEPPWGVARIGDNGGHSAKLEAVFRARGTSWGEDGVAGTEDDIDLGYIDDVRWRTVPRDEAAEHDEDVKFSGQMDPATGRFVPAGAGPNPARPRSTNNAGNLNVVASYEQDGRVVEGTGRLLVTVQRWNQPPLK